MAEAFAFVHPIEVRFRDCDAMGHVNNSVYFTYFEQCRLLFWRKLTGEPNPRTTIILAHAECDFRAPAHFGDRLEVRTRVAAVGRSSVTMSYALVDLERDRTIAEGTAVLVSYDYERRESRPLPEPTRALLDRVLRAQAAGAPPLTA
jgi:acyl-CoA thioester hydrolase